MTHDYPDWFVALMGAPLPREGQSLTAGSVMLQMRGGLLRDETCDNAEQIQTRSTFAYKWTREETYASDSMRAHARGWLIERYGALGTLAGLRRFGERPLLLDAGCGSSYSGELLFGPHLQHVRYVGADISRAVDIAVKNFRSRDLPAAFVQADLMRLPFPDEAFDIVFSEGVLHHTPSTKAALAAIARKARRGGAVAFYVYAKKSPLREFSDDFIRAKVVDLDGNAAWEKLMPLTKLGQALGQLNLTVDVTESVDLLGIPKGPIDVQRLFYWHVCKMFYRPELSLDEMNHINFDWFVPAFAHRQSPEEISGWCEELGLAVEAMSVEDAGVTTIAIRK